ncbi:hypothetical protein AOX55_000036 [Sinorhizobium fredii CCBAU 25509]|nr:hypothetical protein AOX55_000036 [Sinorhizobium fredii CCBAU 25509]
MEVECFLFSDARPCAVGLVGSRHVSSTSCGRPFRSASLLLSSINACG